MPFVTEELWSRTPGHSEFLMRSPWPDAQFVDPGAEETFAQVMRIVEEVRGHRQAAGAPPRAQPWRWPVRRLRSNLRRLGADRKRLLRRHAPQRSAAGRLAAKRSRAPANFEKRKNPNVGVAKP
jgi:valyl-tRNA synthetase